MGVTAETPAIPHVVYLFDKGYRYCSVMSAFSVLQHCAGPIQITFFTATDLPGMAQATGLLQKAFPRARINLRVEAALGFTFDTGDGLPAATYGRLLLPELVEGRVLYLDGDTFARHDVTALFQMDLEGKCLASALDSFIERDLAYRDVWWSGKLKPHLMPMINNPDLIDPTRYYNAGVMVMDMERIRSTPDLQPMFDPESAARFVVQYSFPFSDQDWINHKAAGHFKTLDPIWNSINGNFRTTRPPLAKARRQAYAESRRDPAILHFAGRNKPWLPDNGAPSRRKKISAQEKIWHAEYHVAMADMTRALGQDLTTTLQ